MKDYKVTAQMLRYEFDNASAYLRQDLRRLAGAKTNLDAYEALNVMVVKHQQTIDRLVSIANDIVYRVLEDGKRERSVVEPRATKKKGAGRTQR